MSHTLEAKIEYLCDQILKADSENWDTRNRAVIQITELILEYDGLSAADLNDAFTPNLYRSLKEPVKVLVSTFLLLSPYVFLMKLLTIDI